ncbi:MAG TPA: prephenate dehydratase domain-containing protein [Planctomycetota bacterium]
MTDPALEQAPARFAIACFGSRGSFGAEAAERLRAERYPGAVLVMAATPEEALALLARGAVERAVVPVANSSAGLVADTLAALGGRRLVLDGELVLPVRITLWVRDARVAPGAIRSVASHPHALAQCRRTLGRLLGAHAERAWRDTAAAASALALGELGPETAVLASRAAGAAAGLHALQHDVQDAPDNRTFFAVLRRPAGNAVE